MSRKQHADLDFLSISRIRNLPAPANSDEPVRKAELDGAIEGLKQKDPVMVRTQGNIDLSSPGATVDGETLTAGSRELGAFIAGNQTATAENGIYIWNGAATPATRAPDASTAAELNGALVPVKAGTDAGKLFRQTATVVTLGTDPVTWAAFGTGASQATETAAGIAELATQAETDAGTDDQRIVTPLKLATWSGRKVKAFADIGDSSATQFDVTHNFGTYDLLIRVRRNASPYDDVDCDIERVSANTARVRFNSAPSAAQFRVIIIG